MHKKNSWSLKDSFLNVSQSEDWLYYLKSSIEMAKMQNNNSDLTEVTGGGSVLSLLHVRDRRGQRRRVQKLRAVLLSHPLLDEGMFVLQLPLLHGRVDDQLIQLHRAKRQQSQRDGFTDTVSGIKHTQRHREMENYAHWHEWWLISTWSKVKGISLNFRKPGKCIFQHSPLLHSHT